MNDTRGSINFDITANNDDLKRKLAESRQALLDSGRTAEEQGSKIESMFKHAAVGAGVFFSAQQALQFAKQIAIVRGEFQQLEVAFTTMLGSATKGKAMMRESVELAANTPFDLKGVAQGAKQLLAYGSDAKAVTKELTMLGNIAAGLSIPLGDMVYLYGTTQTQGRLYTQDMRQFMGRGIPLAEELAKQFGVTKDKISEMVTAGKIGFPEVQKALQSMTSEGGKFNNLMEMQSKTITGQISNLGDAIDVMFNKMGQSQEGFISSSIGMATSLVENYEKVGRILVGLVATYGTYKAATIAYYALTKTYGVYDIASKELQFAATMKNIAATEAMTIKQAILNKTMLANPYVLITTLLVGAAVATWALYDSTTASEKAQKAYDDENEEAIRLEQEHKGKIDALIQSATDENLSTLTRVKSLQTLKKEYPQIFAQYDIEKLKLADILAIKLQIAEADSEKKAQDDVAKYNQLKAVYDKAKAAYDRLTSQKDENGKPVNEGSWAEKQYKERLSAAASALAPYEKGVRENNINTWIATLGQLTEKQLQAELAARKRLQANFAHNERIGKQNSGGGIKGGTLEGAFTPQQIAEQVDALNLALNNLHPKVLPFAEQLDEAKRKLPTLKKDLEDLYAGVTPKEAKEGFSFASAIEDKKKQIKEAEKDINTLLNKSPKPDKSTQSEVAQQTLSGDVALQNSRIALMREGKRRELAELELKTQEELQKIKDDKAAMLKAQGSLSVADDASFNERESNTQSAAQRNRFDIEVKYAQEYKELYSQITDVFLTAEERKQKGIEDTYEAYRTTLKKMHDGGSIDTGQYLAAVWESEQAQATAGTAELLDKYETYFDKRKRIAEQGEAEITKLGGRGGERSENVRLVEEQMQNALLEVDMALASKQEAYQSWLVRISDTTLQELTQMLEEVEKKLQEAEKTGNAKPDQVALFRTQKNILTKGIGSAKGSKTPKQSVREWKALNKVLVDTSKLFGDIGDEIGGVAGEAISVAGQIATSAASMVDGIATVVDGVSIGIDATGKTVVTAMSTIDKASAILMVISAALQIATKIASLFSKDHELSEQTIKSYNAYMEVTDKLIDQQKELIETVTGAQAAMASDKALDMIKKEEDATRSLGRAYLASRAKNSHSYGVQAEKRLRDNAMEIENAGFDWEKLRGSGRMEGLFDLSVEEIKRLQEMLPEVWAELDDDTRKYLETIIECTDKTKDIGLAMKETLTNTTLDDLKGNLEEFLNDVDASFDDVGKSFEETMMSAINRVVARGLDQDLAKWYDDFSKAMSDDTLTDAEREDLKAQYEKVYQDAIKKRDAANQIAGIPDTKDDREASERGIATASQESVDENNGRLTAMQSIIFDVRENQLQMLELQKATLPNLQNLAHLTSLPVIADNTSYCRRLEGIETNMGFMRQAIETIRDNGIILKKQ